MSTDLDRCVREDGRNVATVADWIAQELGSNWEEIWQDHLPMISEAYERMGRARVRAVQPRAVRPHPARLSTAGLVCKPPLPGTLPLSEEDWGPEEHRERRMWTLLHDEHGTQLGAVVTRFFHDHSQLRLPEPPTAVGLSEVDHDQIRRIVVQDPAAWPPARTVTQ